MGSLNNLFPVIDVLGMSMQRTSKGRITGKDLRKVDLGVGPLKSVSMEVVGTYETEDWTFVMSRCIGNLAVLTVGQTRKTIEHVEVALVNVARISHFESWLAEKKPIDMADAVTMLGTAFVKRFERQPDYSWIAH